MNRKETKTHWRNRIIGYGTESPDQLLANPRNWRIHPKAQQDALQGVLDEVGWVQAVIVNRRTGFVVDGHLRVALAISRGEKTIPVVYVDLSAEEEAEIMATLDPIGALAVPDGEKLDDLIREIQSENPAIGELLNQMRRADPLLRGEKGLPSSVAQIPERFMVLVECHDEAEQVSLLSRLTAEGYKCRALIS